MAPEVAGLLRNWPLSTIIGKYQPNFVPEKPFVKLNGLFWKADLLTRVKGNKKKCGELRLLKPSRLLRYKGNYDTRK